MLSGCLIHTIDSILPPGDTLSHDFGRLEYHAAIKLLEKTENAETYLRRAPIRIFQTLFHTIVCKHFYGNINSCEPSENNDTLRKSLLLLLKYWPGQSFILRDLMPALPPTGKKLKMWKNIQDPCEYKTSVQLSKEFIIRYYMYILNVIFDTFMEACKYILSHKNRIIIRTFDISGYFSSFEKGFNPKKFFRCMVESFSNCKIDLLCDAVCNDESDFVALTTIAKNNTVTTGIQIHFRKITFNGNPSNALKLRFDILNKLGIEYCELYANDKKGMLLSSIISSLPNLKGFSILVSNATSIYLLSHLPSLNHLSELDLSRISLRGQLKPLIQLPKGLVYLNLAGCSIQDDDLQELTYSHHSKTLRHVNISENRFTLRPNLIEFCLNLVNVEILVLQDCVFEFEYMIELSQILCGLRGLKFIDLKDNKFSSDIVHCISLELCKSKSLKCAVFSVPVDLYFGNDALLVSTLRILKRSLGRRKEGLLKKDEREFTVPPAFYTPEVQDRLKEFYTKVIKGIGNRNTNLHVVLEP